MPPAPRGRLRQIGSDHAKQAAPHRGPAAVRNHLAHAERCYELFALAGHRSGQALALQDVGRAHAILGHYDLAIANCERALLALRDVGETSWEGAAWDTLGYTHHQRGDYEQAITCYEQAAELATGLGDRYNEADTFNNIGDVHRSADDLIAANRAWTRALRIFDEIDHPDRDQVRAKLQAPVEQPA